MTALGEDPPGRAVARIPATCGELLQGVDAWGPVLVSLPLERSGRVEVELRDAPGLEVVPSRARARAALARALEALGWRGGARAALETRLPGGRGLGSSTVDVAGVIAAAAAAAAAALDDADLLRLATAVDPTDSSPFAGLVAIDHVGGGRLRRLGQPPRLIAVAVDSGPPLDTVAVHRRHGPGPDLPAGTLDRLADAVADGDVLAIGRIATASARRNQERLPNPAFDAVLEAAAAAGAPGICVAHSGTLAAVLCAGEEQARAATGSLMRAGLSAACEAVAAPGRRIEVQRRPTAGRPLP